MFFAYLTFFKTFFINRVLELSKANEKQSRSINFSVGTSANKVFGLVFILKNCVLVGIFR